MMGRAVIGCFAVGLFLWLGWDGHLYWHDIRYLYAAQNFTLAELFSGIWNPQYGQPLNDSASGTFYVLKVGYLVLLKTLFWVSPNASVALLAAQLISFLGCVVTVLMVPGIVARSPGQLQIPDGWGAALLFALSPTIPYLAGKLLAESLALPFAAASIAALQLAHSSPSARKIVWIGLAALAFTVCALSRINATALPLGYLAAVAWSAHSPGQRRVHVQLLMAGILWQLLLVGLVFVSSGLGLTGLMAFGHDFLSAGKSGAVSLVGGVAALGWLLPLATLGAMASGDRARSFASAWTLATGIPTLAAVVGYQVEARYLVGALIPLAVLSWLGVRSIALRLDWATRSASVRRLTVVGALAALFCGNALAASVLPWEVDQRAFDRLLRRSEVTDPNATLLLPWAYTDYHYAATLHPQLNLGFVHVPVRDGVVEHYDEPWTRRLDAWYGTAHLADASSLDALFQRGPVYVLSWQYHPPLERWAQRTQNLGWSWASTALIGLAGQSHADQTWLVDVPLRWDVIATDGQYTLSQIRPAQPSTNEMNP